MTIIDIKNVRLTFPGSSHSAINHVSYQIKKNDFIILLGGNGSGKSTFLKLLSRQYILTSGKINFLAKPIETYSNKMLSHLIGVVTQNSADSLFTSLTVFENYLLVKKNHFYFIHHQIERKKLAEHLINFNVNLSKKLDTTVEQLSGGEKQAFALALRLLTPPALLLLDEHTSALDPKTSAQIMQLTNNMIEQHHITCVLTTHDLDLALKYGNRIILLHDGEIHRVIDSQEKKVLTKSQLVSYYF